MPNIFIWEGYYTGISGELELEFQELPGGSPELRR